MKKWMCVAIMVGSFCMMSLPLIAAPKNKGLFPTYTGRAATLIASDVTVKSYPNDYARSLEASPSKDVYIVGQNAEWYKIKFNDQEGWVQKSDISCARTKHIPYSKVLGEEIVDYGKQFIGTPYVWGGNDLKTGVDCSGLTKEVYETFDIGISRVAASQIKDGKPISKSDLMPGDLVFFDTTTTREGRISHVGIYAGGDMFLHADCTYGVMLSNLNSPYYLRNYVASSRIIDI